MKPLDPEEYRLLTVADNGSEVVPGHVWKPLHAAGLLRFTHWNEADLPVLKPSESGHRAIRIHRAYLSVGGP